MPDRPKTESEYRFIEGLLLDDPQAIDEIYSRFSGSLLALIRKNGGTVEDAKDVFQDALMVIWEKFKKEGNRHKRPTDVQFGKYLYSVGRFLWLKKRQKPGLTNQDFLEYHYDGEADRLAEETARETTWDRLVWKCFEKLTPKCRELLELAWSGNFSMKAVARAVNKAYPAARVKKTECIKKLIELIKLDPDFIDLNYH